MISELEIRRRMFHLGSGIIIVGLIYYDILDWIITLILLVLLIILGLIVKKAKVPVASWFFEKFDRPKDFKKLPGKGSVFYLLGVLFALLLFPKDVAMASIIILAVGDSISPIVGQYGNIENPFNRKKFIEGSIAGGLVAFLAAMLFVRPLEAGAASFFAMVAEGIDLKLGVNQLDDNIVMPLTAGIAIMILRLLLA